MSGDAHHVVSPEPSGHGARLCMARALQRAGARPQDVSYVNAHATSTPVGNLWTICLMLTGVSMSEVLLKYGTLH